MKIGILKHPLGANYGGILQSFALSTYLQNQGHDVTVLNRQSNLPFAKRLIKSFLIAMHHPRYNSPRYRHLSSFVKKYINYSKPLYTDSQMKNIVMSRSLDAVIVGSDQVWRTGFAMGYGYNYFLDFVPAEVRKLSYAASFGLSNWEYSDEQTDRIKRLVSRFNAISVREDEGVTLCKDNLDINAEHVLDPTMLLQPEDYAPITNKRLVDDDYVFVYWLGSAEDKQKAIADAHIEGKKLVDISLRGSEPLMPIEDWLSYIQYADHVVTDSFHGCVFSILFQKQFTICANNSGGNGRLKSLFTMLNIDPTKGHIDYSVVNESLYKQRNHSYGFIKNALQ